MRKQSIERRGESCASLCPGRVGDEGTEFLGRRQAGRRAGMEAPAVYRGTTYVDGTRGKTEPAA